MENPYIIIDDLLPQETADDIEAMLFKELPWRFISDITYDGTNQNTPAMSHVFMNIEFGQDFKSPFLHKVMPIVSEGVSRINYDFKTLLKARTFLQLPLHDNFSNVSLDTLHTDQPYPHLVFLYYVIDADGDTVIVNKTLEEGKILQDLCAEHYETLAVVSPKKNRLVIFDGKYYHTAHQPKTGLRCILNFNLLGEFK